MNSGGDEWWTAYDNADMMTARSGRKSRCTRPDSAWAVAAWELELELELSFPRSGQDKREQQAV
jgi:hypothetical protein